jgi:polysaccharide biosynthesis/export protein
LVYNAVNMKLLIMASYPNGNCPNLAEKQHLSLRQFIQVMAVSLLLVCIGCQGPTVALLPERSVGHTPVSLSPGATIKLSFPGEPKFDQIQKIRADGKISLPLVGEVNASGKRVADFQEELSRLYKSQIWDTEVVVSLESSAVAVLVTGAVTKPGKVMFERPLTVLEAIMEAGGITAMGNPKKVHLIRLANGEHRTRIFDLRPVLNGKTSSAFYVEGGDVIFVEESIF